MAVESDLRAANSVLAATLESTADGILVVDRVGSGHEREQPVRPRCGSCHPECFDDTDDSHALAFVLDQLCDPTAFVAKVQRLYDEPEAVSHDTLEFKDGRVFERDSLPQRIDGEVVGRVWSFRDVTEHRRLQNELSHQAFHDPLTGLANQALFRDRVDHAATRLQRNGGQLAVLFIDLDDFKTVNDSLGHSAGDELLVIVSERLSSCLRAGDTAARLGGDEFAVLMDELGDPDERDDRRASASSPRCRNRSCSSRCRSRRPRASASRTGPTGAGSDEMLRNADLAMYTAKAGGKNCVARVRARDAPRRGRATRPRGAPARRRRSAASWCVHYQPIYELDTGRIDRGRSARPLAASRTRPARRRSRSSRSRRRPASSTRSASHVLVTACEEAARLDTATLGKSRAPSVSVNVSPRQLLDADAPRPRSSRCSSAAVSSPTG